MNEREFARFQTKFSIEASGCWRWRAAKNADGYGRFHAEGRGAQFWLAHRIAYVHWVGAIPDGLQLDHLCRNPWCVNPAHLQPVSLLENVQRGKHGALKDLPTHCASGHLYDAANTYHSRQANCADGVRRQCRACKRDWMREKRHTAA